MSSDSIPAISIRSSQRGLIEQLKGRLILAIGVLVTCFILSSIVGTYASISQQQLGEQKLAIHNDESQLLQAMVDQETGLRGYISTNSKIFLDPLNAGRTQYSEALRHLQAETSGKNFHATSVALATAEERAADWSTNFADIQIATMDAGNLNMARSSQTQELGKIKLDAFRRSIDQLQRATDSDLANVQSQVSIINYTALASSGILAVLVIIWVWRTYNHFSAAQRRQLDILKNTAAAFGAGDLSVRVHEVTDEDLRDVGRTFNKMAETLKDQQNALHDRDILEQVSQLNSILTSSLDLRELIDNFLQAALPLLDIQIGALYLYDPATETLNLFTARGLQKEDIQTTFALGEGLIGRVAKEHRSLMVSYPKTDTHDTFRIKTMLGTTLPTSMYHLPLQCGSDLLGVLAVGSMYSMREQTRNVFHVIASNVSSAISNAQAYAHTQDQARELIVLARDQEKANHVLRQQRDELTILNSALEEANLARSRFLSTMSHELRTPLTSIIGFGQMLLRTTVKAPLTERQANNIDRILKNAQHLLVLINDVLDLAKVEAGRMDVNAAEVDLRQLVSTVVEETRSVAVTRGLRITVDISDEVTVLETDPLKLRQILLNLLSNAFKFTEKGGVTISAVRRTSSVINKEGTSEAEQVAISVKDTGIGIPREKQARIFEAFYQVDNSNSRSYGGTGLGLSIVREFTTLLGGKIEIESVQGEGTTFNLLLPLHPQDRQSLQDVRLNTLHGPLAMLQQINGAAHTEAIIEESKQREASEELLVVAIDDNSDVLQLISASLEQSPYRVVGIQDSSQAVAAIQELRPHVVTLDIMMPKVNGWQILHHLKSNPATAMIPVILLTVLEDRSAGYVLGADEYLVKPVARDALLTTLYQLTQSHNADGTLLIADVNSVSAPLSQESIQNREGQPAPMRSSIKPALVVHNENDIHGLIKRLVAETGYNVQKADGQQDVIAMIEQVSPDMLMLLVQMEHLEEYEQKSNTVIESKDVSRSLEDLE